MILRLCCFGSKNQDGRKKDRGYKKLARVSVSQRYLGFFRLCKLL